MPPDVGPELGNAPYLRLAQRRCVRDAMRPNSQPIWPLASMVEVTEHVMLRVSASRIGPVPWTRPAVHAYQIHSMSDAMPVTSVRRTNTIHVSSQALVSTSRQQTRAPWRSACVPLILRANWIADSDSASSLGDP